MATEIQNDFEFEVAKAELPLTELDQAPQLEFDMSTSAFSFSSGCLTPPASNSTVGSRRSSDALFDTYSSPKTPISNRITFPFPGSQGRQPNDCLAINSSTPLQPSTTQGPPIFTQNPFESPVPIVPYAYGASALSAREAIGYGNLENEIFATGGLSRKPVYDWQSLDIHGGAADPVVMGASENLVFGNEHVYDPLFYSQKPLSSTDLLNPNPSSSSPQTILPSQTLVSPCGPLSGPVTPPELAPKEKERTSSPKYAISPMTHKIDSYYQSDRKVLAVVVKPARLAKASLNASAQKGNSKLRTTGPRKCSPSDQDFDQWNSNDSYEIKTLKAECTSVESHKSKKYLCEICPQGFDRQEHWKRHEKTATHREKLKKLDKARLGPEPPMYYCRVCKKGLNRHDNVKPHEESHLPSSGKTRRHTPIPIEKSLELGMGDMDPRINPDLKRKTRKKARLH